MKDDFRFPAQEFPPSLFLCGLKYRHAGAAVSFEIKYPIV